MLFRSHFLGGGETVQQLSALERSADEALLADADYRLELARWIGEGQLGTSWMVAKLGELALARLPAGGGMTGRVAEDDAARVQSAPLAGLLSTRADTALAQLHAGEAYLRIALAAESMGLRMQPLSPVLEWQQSRHELATLAGLHERFPQHLFRIGHGEPEPGAHRRRPLGEVLLQA